MRSQVVLRIAKTCMIMVLGLIAIGESQNICSGCVDVNYNNFTCNNLGCDGFRLTQSQKGALNFNSIQCLGQNGGCYYSSNSLISYRAYSVYLFCNFTFPGCSSCSNDQTCSTCQNGFFPNAYNTVLELINCLPCQEYIGGCEMCTASNVCTQCNPQYLNIFGFCYTPGGSIVGPTSKPWNQFGSTPTEIITAVELFLLISALFFALYKFCCVKPKPNSTNPPLESAKLHLPQNI